MGELTHFGTENDLTALAALRLEEKQRVQVRVVMLVSAAGALTKQMETNLPLAEVLAALG